MHESLKSGLAHMAAMQVFAEASLHNGYARMSGNVPKSISFEESGKINKRAYERLNKTLTASDNEALAKAQAKRDRKVAKRASQLR